jgi:hypothetical protein
MAPALIAQREGRLQQIQNSQEIGWIAKGNFSYYAFGINNLISGRYGTTWPAGIEYLFISTQETL